MRAGCALAGGLAIGLVWLAPAEAAGNWRRGERIVKQYCSDCHALTRRDESRLREAPPLRGITARYPAENLEEALVEGILVGHKDMPEFEFDPDQAEDIIAYLKRIGPRRDRR
jgi:mono/diheme cytochrome c family protein